MKKWIGVLVSIVILVLVSYYVMGFVAKRTLHKNIDAIPKTPFLTVKLDKYRQGWFSSKTTLMLTLHLPEQQITTSNGAPTTSPATDLDIKVPLSIKHGPLVFTDNGTRFGIAQVTTKPETHYGVFINYLNQTIMKYTFPALSMQGNLGDNQGDFQFDWRGFSAWLGVSANLDNIDGHLKLYGFNVSDNKVVVNVGKTINDFQLKRHQDGLWLGQSHFDIPSVVVNETGQKLFKLEGFDLNIDSQVVDNALNFNFKLSLQELFTNDVTYGPANLKLSIKNLDPAVMAEINKQQLNMLQNNADSNLLMLSMVTQLPKLLAKGAELNLSEMTVSLPEGKVVGDLKIALPKNETNAEQLMQKAHGEGEFRAPMSVIRKLMVSSIQSDLANKPQSPTIEPATTPGAVANPSTAATPDLNAQAQAQADKILQNLVNKGVLKVDGNDYILHFKLENQQVMVNGQVFNPAMLQ